MGPLVPDVISTNMNLIFALIIGVLFGTILEKAGFSSSRKLVGLFYGYDFTVLRVFFTAGVTGMFGIIVLDHFGFLDVNLIYINPTFVGASIVGGLIMGMGFVVGGYCPGTSVCAAAIGKIDAMYFILGIVGGILIFAEGYPLWEGFYKANNLGYIRIFDTLGMSQSFFAFLLTVIAMVAFWGTSIIQKKVNGIHEPIFKFTPYHLSLTAIGAFIAVSAFFVPPQKETLLAKVEDEKFVAQYEVEQMDIDEFAYRIMDRDKKMQIFDFRSFEEYKEMSIPNSISFSVNNFFEKEPNRLLNIQGRTNVFIANSEIEEKKIAVIAQEMGYENIEILSGGIAQFQAEILEFSQEKPVANDLNRATLKFRTKAAVEIPEMIKNNKPAGKVEKKLKRVVGGC